MHRYRLLVAVMLQWLMLALSPAQAQVAPPAITHIAASLIAEAPASPGGGTTLAIHMRPEAGWHGYWLNPGDAGLGMTFDWQLPPELSAGEPRYPVPQTLLVSGLMNHVYEHDYAVLVPLRIAPDARPGALPVTLHAQWLACTREVCVPEQATLSTTVTIGAGAKPDPRFDGWRAALPAPLGAQARFTLDSSTIRIGIPLPATVALDRPHLFLGEDKVVDYAAPQRFFRQGDLLVVELPRAKFAPVDPASLSGVLALDSKGTGLEFAARPGPVAAGGTPVDATPKPDLPVLPLLLLGALVGGLLLNVMPCVFPILSLKALSLARAGESEAEARAEGLAYGAGVVLACAALGGVLLGLRAAGAQVGWAFQLQEPLVVVGLLLLATAITANLAGLFEFAVPGFARAGSPRNAFATGLLAAFVATPCTGPFMAAAMGAALLLPLGPAMALFVALGIGIAFPFLAIAFVPPLRRRLPKPGAWMASFRHWMALPMGLTAMALAWLAYRLGGHAFALATLALAAWLLVALAVAGRRQRSGESAGVLLLSQLAAIVLIAALVLPAQVAIRGPDEAPSILPTAPFSEARLAEARAAGKPVFAYFTADWCLTCKVNERVAIERESTRAAFARARVVVLRGDWTRRDPAITRYLTEHGAAGVPLYVWYPAGGGTAQVLPQVLTPDMLASLPASGAPSP